MNAPMVSVVMSVCDGERYLSQALESILGQTFHDFECIVINDGSRDETGAILVRYEKLDPRMRVYHQENHGLIYCLNKGCELARGKYIARMDADDVSMPERFSGQVRYLEANKDIGIVGTWVEYIDETGASLGEWATPSKPAVIEWFLLFGNCLAHPSVMMRRDVVERVGSYSDKALYVEDYDLWVRSVGLTRLANIPESLVKRRICEEGVSQQHYEKQEENAVKIMHAMMTRLVEREISDEVIAKLRLCKKNCDAISLEEGDMLAALLRRLHRLFLSKHKLSDSEAKQVARDVGKRLLRLAERVTEGSLYKGLVIYSQAFELNPSLITFPIAKKILKAVVERWFLSPWSQS